MAIKAVLSVLGKDRKGIVALVSTTLSECGVNINEISQTILDDIFTMIMTVTIDEEACTFDEVQERLNNSIKDSKLQVNLQRSDVFDFMYKV